MGKYIQILNENFRENNEEMDRQFISRLDYIGDVIFDFTTYDSSISELLASKILEVIEVILDRKAFEYQKIEENYINYLTMVNMPFLDDKLDWGTSIRGAWFRHDLPGISLDCGRITVQKGEIEIFLRDVFDWLKIIEK